MKDREPRKFQHDITPYLDALGEFEGLSRPQEVEYAKRIEAGLYAQKLLEDADERYAVSDLEDIADEGTSAKRLLIIHNLRWVAKNAFEMWSSPIDLSDCIQAGNLGLIIAIEHFDYTKGIRLSTFSRIHIRGAISQLFENENKFYKFDDPRFKPLESLDREVMLGGITMPLMEYLRRTLASETTSHAKRDLMEKRVDAILNNELSEQEAEIIRVFYGFYGLLPQTTHQIADEVGIPYTEVRRILREARQKLRDKHVELLAAISTLDM